MKTTGRPDGYAEPEAERARLTVRLPKKDLEFAKQYARDHRMTLTELIGRYFELLQWSRKEPIHPEVERISGIIPSEDVDPKDLYREHLIRKHQ